jgi:carboxyvinyl-carboxyphosphonate phosphorylmutase
VYDTLKALREGTRPKDLPNLASAELMDRVTRADDLTRWTREFLGADQP